MFSVVPHERVESQQGKGSRFTIRFPGKRTVPVEPAVAPEAR